MMIVLEILLYLFSIALIWMMMTKTALKKQYIIAAIITAFVAATIFGIIGNPGWQFYSLFAAMAVLMISVFLKRLMNVAFRKGIRITIYALSISFLVVSGMANILFPTYEVPEPSGVYLIGTQTFVLEDPGRLEIYTDEPNDIRKINIQVWYPAESIEGYARVPWLEDGLKISRALATDFGFPAFLLDQTSDVKSNSYLNAPISNDADKYPIIIISHGWRGFRDLHLDYAEELASQGYIVIGIDHTYGAVATVFEDGEVAYLNPEALPPRDTTPDFLDYANQLVDTYAQDVTTTLDYLNDIVHTNTYEFDDKLDLDTIGLLGHSTGGGGVVTVALNDDRIDAVMGLDAWVEPIVETEIEKGLSIPSLFLRSEDWKTGLNNNNLYSLVENSAYPSILFQINGITHFDFAMVYMYSPLTNYIGFSGRINDDYLVSMLKSLVTDFFNQNLKHDTDVEPDPNEWEEVEIVEIP